MINYKQIIAIFLGAAFVLCLGLWIYLNNHYAYARPNKPQPEIGRIYPLNIHGTIVFLTEKEDLQLKGLFYGTMLFFGIIFLFNYFFSPFSQSNRGP